MPNYLVVKILDVQSVAFAATQVYGTVEFRSFKADQPAEIEALKDSAKHARLEYDNYAVCGRIATVVECEERLDAEDLAEVEFSKVLDLKAVEFATSNFQTSNIGLTKNLDDGSIVPIRLLEYQPSISFMMHRGSVQQWDATNYILHINNELSNRLARSLHWTRNSKHEKNRQLKILFHWFALEALLKENEYDNIDGIVRWFLGFPSSKHRENVSPALMAALRNHPRYDFWHKELNKTITNIKIFRNNSVHSGFRSVDFTKRELELYSLVMIFAASRCQYAARLALINELSTVAELKEYIAPLFELNSNMVNDVHNNIIFSLDRILHPQVND